MTTQTKVKPETPETRAFFEDTVRDFREWIASTRREADKLASEGSPASRAEARRYRWHATRGETELRLITEWFENRQAKS
jgi:hypothetical protein